MQVHIWLISVLFCSIRPGLAVLLCYCIVAFDVDGDAFAVVFSLFAFPFPFDHGHQCPLSVLFDVVVVWTAPGIVVLFYIDFGCMLIRVV